MLSIVMILLIVGCESKALSDKNLSQFSEAGTENKTNELREAMNKISELNEANQSLIKQNEELKIQAEKDADQYKRLEQLVNRVTQLEKYGYEILSKKVNRPPYDCVVYVPDASGKPDEQEVYVLRSAIQFSGKDFTRVSLWKDRQTAMKYVNGDYDPEEGVLGWSGFDQRFGVIDNTHVPPSLIHYFSRDDAQVIEFGKFGYDK